MKENLLKLHKLNPLLNISCSELEPASTYIAVIDKISIVAQMLDGLTKIQYYKSTDYVRISRNLLCNVVHTTYNVLQGSKTSSLVQHLKGFLFFSQFFFLLFFICRIPPESEHLVISRIIII